LYHLQAARSDRWLLTSLPQRLVKTGGRLMRQARYYWLLLVENRAGSLCSMLHRIGVCLHNGIPASTASAKPEGTREYLSWLTTRQLEKLAEALTVARQDKRSVLFSDRSFSESAYILLSGVARITCDNRKGQRTTVIMVAPAAWMVSACIPPASCRFASA
jgi:hypothetical protein